MSKKQVKKNLQSEGFYDRRYMVGDWNTEPISFELKEGAKPYHGRPFPVPRVHKETKIKE